VLSEVAPGLLLTVLVAWIGMSTSGWLGTELMGFERSPISGIMLAVVLGMVLGNLVKLPAILTLGTQFSMTRLLRIGIILLGIRLGLGEVIQFGLVSIPLILLCIVVSMAATYFMSKKLELSTRMGTLIAVGTSICGATAIVATAPSIGADDEEVAYALGNITIFGVVAMFVYPILARAIFADDVMSAGRFLGTAIHETGQVAGSGLIYEELFGGQRVLDVAAVTKLIRNLCMLLVIPAVAYVSLRTSSVSNGILARKGSLRSSFPTFIIGFILLSILRSVGDAGIESDLAAFGMFDSSTWQTITKDLASWSERLLAVAMAGLGLRVSFGQLRSLGFRPFYVGLVAAVTVGLASLLGIAMLNIVFPAIG
jgi:uncharacterized integral membrane protein (TIGR00698 family)